MRRAIVLLLASTAACSAAPASKPGAGAPAPCRASAIISPGQPIPADCEFTTIGGETLRLSALKGTPTLLNFWASWCPNCVEELPALEQAHKHFGARVRFLGANLLGVDGETTKAAQAFAKRFGLTYESIYDRGGLLYAHFSPRLFPPTTVLIDAEGFVRYRKFGPLDLRELRADIGRYLGVT